MSNIIPAQPGFTYIELGWLDDELERPIHQRHPVIGWIEAGNGGFSYLGMQPVMMVKRTDDDMDWGVMYPDHQVVTADGVVFRSLAEWQDSVKERLRGENAEQQAKAKQAAE
jgi:hypothetical protein